MYQPMEWLATDPPRVAPPLMTATEAVAYLRLDEGDRDIADALKSLERLVGTGLIRPCRVGRFNRYARAELDRFIHEQTQSYASKYTSGNDPAVRSEEGVSDGRQG